MIEHPTDEEQVDTDSTVSEAVDDGAVDSLMEADETEAEEDAVETSEDEEEATSGTRLILKRSGEETDIVFPFSTPAIIGRFDPSIGPIDIDLGSLEEAGYVSRKHAQIVSEDGSYKLKDMGSSNGTYVLRDDFEKIDEADISNGDEIAFGNARFVFRV